MPHTKTFLTALCCFFTCFISTGHAVPPVKITVTHQGSAVIEDSSTPYQFFRIHIEAPTPTTITFKQDTCILIGKDGQQNSECWIQIVGGGAGLSEEKTAPIDMKTLTDASPAKDKTAPVLRFNTSKIDGPDGAIAYSIPKSGFVELRLFWPVSNEFQAKRIVLKNIGEFDLLPRVR